MSAVDILVAAIEAKTGRSGRRQGRAVRLLCPAHDDHDPSLDVSEGDNGAAVVQCRSHGCTYEQIIEAVGLTPADLAPSNGQVWTPAGDAIAVYDYVDEDGTLLFQVCRTASKDFLQRVPDPAERSGWRWKLGDTRRVIYRLPRVLEAGTRGEDVWIVEGEKDVQALERTGVTATCNPMGAGKWSDEYATFLIGANVTIVADRDPAGMTHAQRVADSLERAGVKHTIVLAAEGKDASDHLASGRKLDEFQHAGDPALQEVQVATPPRLHFLLGRDFLEQPLARISPLIGTEDDALMMPGSLGILAGVGGAGKTTLALHAIAHWTAGLAWFGIAVPRAIRAVIIENEGPHDPFVKKVKEFAARFKNCPCCDVSHGDLGQGLLENCLFLDSPWGHFTFEDKDLAAELRNTVLDFGGDIVLANPLGRLGMRGAGTPEETRAFLQLMFDAGLNEDFAALLLHHMSKIGRHVPLVQQLSGDWGPHPDLILTLEPNGDRSSKLTFGKVRWGDQGRDPLLLEWLTDPNGPVGYKAESAPQGVSDDDMYQRIDAFLAQQEEPKLLSEIRRRVQGNNGRLGELIKQGIADGRYLETGGARSRVWIAGNDVEPYLEPDQLDWDDVSE